MVFKEIFDAFDIPSKIFRIHFPDKLIMTQMMVQMKRTLENQFQHHELEHQQLLEVSRNPDFSLFFFVRKVNDEWFP